MVGANGRGPSGHEVRGKRCCSSRSKGGVLLNDRVEFPEDVHEAPGVWAGRGAYSGAVAPRTYQRPQAPLERSPVEGESHGIVQLPARKPKCRVVMLQSRCARSFLRCWGDGARAPPRVRVASQCIHRSRAHGPSSGAYPPRSSEALLWPVGRPGGIQRSHPTEWREYAVAPA